MASFWNEISTARSLAVVATLSALAAGCGTRSKNETPGQPEPRSEGQTEFVSAPPGAGVNVMAASDAAVASDGGGGTQSGPTTPGDPARKVEETDLYRLDGDRLYYLNAYRGLMVFDVSTIDKPKLIGRSSIFGQPVEMVVRGGIASVIVSDWYGRMDDGKPFHGSIVRGLDARDPSNIKVTGEAKLGGWVRDVRVVGDVIYAVTQDDGWHYGYDEGGGSFVGADSGPSYASMKTIVSAVNFKDGKVTQTGSKELAGYGGVINVTSSAIILAYDASVGPPEEGAPIQTEMRYLDISDPGGTIKMRGAIKVNGRVQGWGADNGRWNLDFADGRYARTLGCGTYYCYGADGSYVFATVDFKNPDAPKLESELKIASTGWSPAVRFTAGRMYLAPANDYYYDPSSTTKPKTPVQIYDTSVPATPKLAGSTEIDGHISLFVPSGNKLFALGNEYVPSPSGWYADSSKIALRYLDVTDATKPSLIGNATFGEGWAWTPAAGTFKAFAKDDKLGLVVLPFSGWVEKKGQYDNGLQLIEFTDTSIKTAGIAKTRGWVERGIFVKNRVVSLSDLALTVIDYTDRKSPKVVHELTLARNVVDAQPQGATIAQLSSDWWNNDPTHSELRVLPITDAEETKSLDPLASVKIEGVNARVFRNGDLAYVASTVREAIPCPGGGPPGDYDCATFAQQVQVVDLAGGKAILKGKVRLPSVPGGYGYGGWYGFSYYDWFNGDDIVQVQGDALAVRRWLPTYYPDVPDATKQLLFVLDMKDPDKPTIASMTVTSDKSSWWGNMRAVGNTLYTTHYEWVGAPDYGKAGSVKYYLDRIDLSNRAAPKIAARVNVPGVLVGASETDPTVFYTIDYRWYGDSTKNEINVVRIVGDKAVLEGSTVIGGWVGNVFVRGNKLYTSAQRYTSTGTDGWSSAGPRVQLHEIDITNPKAPIDRVATEVKGWGWLLGVSGDRAIVTSGWGNVGVDIYKLSPGAAPVFDRFVRTLGWGSSSVTRQGDQLFLASGHWGVQTIDVGSK